MLLMSSTSELFHSRRYRINLRDNDAPGSDSSLADANYSSSHQHRTIIRRRSQHYNSQNNRREHRHDLDGCNPNSRRIHRRRLDHSEHEAVRPEPGGSIVNSDDSRSVHRHRTPESDRLPGAVLLARERLVERLRGVSVSGNNHIRQNSSSSSSRHSNLVLDMRNVRQTTRKHPPGLDQDALNCLQLKVFRNETDETSSRECTVCLEGFLDDDKLIRLQCQHTFHSCCLFPWVRICGACPNCRKPILVNET